MKEKVNEILDCFIAVHRIDQKKKPGAGLSKAAKPGIFLLALLIVLAGAAASAAAFAPGVLGVSSTVGDRELPVYCVETQQPYIALSFDAAWGNEDTPRILEILRKHDVKVTFFMTGGWVESYPDDVKAILADGHDLGNHSENHKNMSQLSDAEKKDELMKVHQKVKELTGYDMFLFRPPYGDYDNAVVRVAKECGYYAIQWDVERLVINKEAGQYSRRKRDPLVSVVTNIYKNIPADEKIKLYLRFFDYIAKEQTEDEKTNENRRQEAMRSKSMEQDAKTPDKSQSGKICDE